MKKVQLKKETILTVLAIAIVIAFIHFNEASKNQQHKLKEVCEIGRDAQKIKVEVGQVFSDIKGKTNIQKTKEQEIDSARDKTTTVGAYLIQLENSVKEMQSAAGCFDYLDK